MRIDPASHLRVLEGFQDKNDSIGLNFVRELAAYTCMRRYWEATPLKVGIWKRVRAIGYAEGCHDGGSIAL